MAKEEMLRTIGFRAKASLWVKLQTYADERNISPSCAIRQALEERFWGLSMNGTENWDRLV